MYQEEQENKKKLDSYSKLLIIVGIVVFLFIVIFSVVSNLNANKSSDIGDIEDSGEKIPRLVYENVTYLEEIAGVNITNRYDKALSHLLLDGKEPGEYKIHINNSSIESGISFPYSIYTFDFSVSDGRECRADFAINGALYAGILIDCGKTDKYASLYIVLSSGMAEAYDRNEVIDDLIVWAKKIYPDGVVVTAD